MNAPPAPSTTTLRRGGVLAPGLGASLVVANTSSVSAILPWIATDLHIDRTHTQWLFASYAITLAAALLPAGALADRHGHRRVFLAGLAAFAVLALAAATSTHPTELLLVRAAQGLAGAVLTTSSLGLLRHHLPGHDQTRAFALWGATIGAGAAIGPLLSGWLTEHHSWRWAMAAPAPACAAVMLIALTRHAPIPGHHSTVDQRRTARVAIVLVTAAFAVVDGPLHGWWQPHDTPQLLGRPWPLPIAPAALAAATALVLVLRRPRRTPSALRPNTGFRTANLIAGVIALGEFGLLAVIPGWIRETFHASPTQVTAAPTALSVGVLIAGALASRTRSHAPLRWVRAGLGIEIATMSAFALAALSPSTWWTPTAWLGLYGLGVGLAGAQLTHIALREIPREQSGVAAATHNAVRQIGTAAGITLVVAAYIALAGSREGPTSVLPSSSSAISATAALVAAILLVGLTLTFLLHPDPRGPRGPNRPTADRRTHE
ncbi:MFS transporter [Embleya sp. NPDC020886]|uniref:MFS transporter n=1 Tax=Embleya sp. NPDC020886 TaxID=3363980 RepID=UPI00379F6AC4